MSIENNPGLIRVYRESDIDEEDDILEFNWMDGVAMRLDSDTRIIAPEEPAPTRRLYIERDDDGPLDIKKTTQLTAVTGDPAVSLRGLKWKTSNKKIAAVTSRGRVTGKGTGTATITVTTKDKRYSAAIDIVVRDMSAPTSLTLTAPKSVIALKEKTTLNAALTAEGTPKTKLKWTTSDRKVATVSAKGVVTGRKPGRAVITATTANGLHGTVEIEVRDVYAPTSLEIIPHGDAAIAVKGKLPLEAKMTSESGTVKTKLKWTSSNQSVATVSSKGIVIGRKPGGATITVTTRNGLTAAFDITVS